MAEVDHEFLYLTGWRIGEVLSLEWSQVDFRSRTVRLDPGTTKNEEGRMFPFDTFPALGDLLKRQRRTTKLVERKVGRIIPSVYRGRGRTYKEEKKRREECESRHQTPHGPETAARLA